MSIWTRFTSFFTRTETLKDEFLRTIAEEIEETPKEVKEVVKAAKAVKTKATTKRKPKVSKVEDDK